jgi:hypothetical protein
MNPLETSQTMMSRIPRLDHAACLCITIEGADTMAEVIKVIEVLAESPKSWEDAANALRTSDDLD